MNEIPKPIDYMKLSSHRWCFTSRIEPVLYFRNKILFIVYQEEKSVNGCIHYQGYVEFDKAYKGSQVKSLFKNKNMNIRTADKSRESNIMYCLKRSTYNGKMYMYNPAHNEEYSITGIVNDYDFDVFDK